MTRSFAILLILASASLAADQPAILKSEFLFDDPLPHPSCHASTIAQSGDALIAAWFGGKREGDPSVAIWLSRDEGKGWSKPIEVANGESPDAKRYPCWNPVLFQPKAGPLMLFYKVGPSPSKWWGMLMLSRDNGKTWDKPAKLPEGILGPIKNKPIESAGGTILCPSSTEDAGWRLHVEFTRDLGQTWTKTSALNDGKTFGAIQPSILTSADGSLALVCRSRQGKVLHAASRDAGQTWSELVALEVPNPNSGVDALTLKDGRHLLVYNDTPKGRTPLNIAISSDTTKWKNVVTLESEPGEYSYPAIIQTPDGLVHVTYTWKRLKIKHTVIDPAKLP